MKKYIIVALILASFLIGMAFHKFFVNRNVKYLILKNDSEIRGFGILKKGTKLKIDKGMPEGFTRYILYLNGGGDIKGTVEESKHDFEINPYWLHAKIDSL